MEEQQVIRNEEPKVIQNSDILYKQNVEWVQDIPYTEPNENELKQLEGTMNASELLRREKEETIKELTPEQKRRNAIDIIKVVSLNRVGLQHFIFHPYKLSTNQKRKYKNSMQTVLDEYNEGNQSRDKITKEFNDIVCDDILNNVTDVSQYPVIDIYKSNNQCSEVLT
jgi:hypothetical protein